MLLIKLGLINHVNLIKIKKDDVQHKTRGALNHNQNMVRFNTLGNVNGTNKSLNKTVIESNGDFYIAVGIK